MPQRFREASGTARPALRRALLLLALTELPEVLRDRIRVSSRDPVGGRCANLAALLLFELPPQLDLHLFEVGQQLRPQLLQKSRIPREPRRIQALHFPN